MTPTERDDADVNSSENRTNKIKAFGLATENLDSQINSKPDSTSR